MKYELKRNSSLHPDGICSRSIILMYTSGRDEGTAQRIFFFPQSAPTFDLWTPGKRSRAVHAREREKKKTGDRAKGKKGKGKIVARETGLQTEEEELIAKIAREGKRGDERHRENRESCREAEETYDSQGKFRCDLHVSRKLQ